MSKVNNIEMKDALGLKSLSYQEAIDMKDYLVFLVDMKYDVNYSFSANELTGKHTSNLWIILKKNSYLHIGNFDFLETRFVTVWDGEIKADSVITTTANYCRIKPLSESSIIAISVCSKEVYTVDFETYNQLTDYLTRNKGLIENMIFLDNKYPYENETYTSQSTNTQTCNYTFGDIHRLPNEPLPLEQLREIESIYHFSIEEIYKVKDYNNTSNSNIQSIIAHMVSFKHGALYAKDVISNYVKQNNIHMRVDYTTMLDILIDRYIDYWLQYLNKRLDKYNLVIKYTNNVVDGLKSLDAMINALTVLQNNEVNKEVLNMLRNQVRPISTEVIRGKSKPYGINLILR